MRPFTGSIVLAALAAHSLHAQAGEILGTWRGTSICVKAGWNSACHDEQVIYHVTPVPNQPDSVALDAAKIVNGKPEPMGIITIGYDPTTKAWAGEWSNARFHLLWAFVVDGKNLTGTLYLLPERRIGRNISAKKD